VNDAPAGALLDKLLACAQTLATAPKRGGIPRELQASGVREYRQTTLKPYHFIDQLQDFPSPAAHTVVVADGRCDMASVLRQRLLLAPASLSAPCSSPLQA
jgi:toxin ParE1/3/4